MKKIVVVILLMMFCSIPLAYAEPKPVIDKDVAAKKADDTAKLNKQKQLLQAIEAAKMQIDALKYRTLLAQKQYNDLVKQLQATTKDTK